MIYLTILQSNKKWFIKFFQFLSKNQCELCLFPEGLKWRNHSGEGIVKKCAFAEYPFNHRRKIGIVPNKPQALKQWFGKWKDDDSQGRMLAQTKIPVAK